MREIFMLIALGYIVNKVWAPRIEYVRQSSLWVLYYTSDKTRKMIVLFKEDYDND